MKKVHVLLLLLACTSAFARGQARPMASRVGDLQVGGTYTVTSSNNNYVQNSIRGIGLYTDFDFRQHWGAEFELHQLNDPNSGAYERTYEWGGRYLRHYGIITPYLKGLYGRGVYNYVDSRNITVANLGYNMAVGGAGVDIAVHRRVNVRLDYEYQDWLSFEGSHDGHTGLKPQLFSIGVAYHFSGGTPR